MNLVFSGDQSEHKRHTKPIGNNYDWAWRITVFSNSLWVPTKEAFELQ